MSEQKKWLYETLTNEGYNVGESYEEFDSLVTNNKDSREWVYEELQGLGYNLGERDEFENLVTRKPISAVQSPQGPFHSKEELLQYKSQHPTPTPTETKTDATTIQQGVASGQVTETPTAPSAPKAEDITTTKATATTAEVPKVETTANPVSALQKKDGTPYSANELQGIASQQQAESTAQVEEQPTVQVESVDESLVTPTETDQAKLETKDTKAEGDQKAEEEKGEKKNAQSIEEYMAQMKSLYGNKYAPQRTEEFDESSLNIPFIEGETSVEVYRNWLDKSTKQYVRNVALANKMKELGATSLTQAQVIEVDNAIKNMSEDDIVAMLGEDGMKVLQGYVNSAKKAEEQDDKNTGVIGRLLTIPGYKQYLEQFIGKGDNKGVTIALSHIMRGADVDLAQMPQEQAVRYLGAKAMRIDSLFGKSGMDYYINAKGDDKVANGMYQCGAIYDELFNSNAPNEAIEFAKKTIKSIEKEGQLGTEDGAVRLDDILARSMEFAVLTQDLTPEDEKRILSELQSYFGGRRQITSIEDVAFGDDYGWELLKNDVIELQQNKGMIQSMDGNVKHLQMLRNQLGHELHQRSKGYRNLDPMAQIHARTEDNRNNPDIALISNAFEFYNDADELLNNSGKTGIEGFWKGFSNALFDKDSWSFGFTDVGKNLLLRNTLQKYHDIESGKSKEQMTEVELAYLDAFATFAAAQALSDPSMAYNVGNGVGYSIPYVLQIALAPVGGGQMVAKTLFRYASKRASQGVLKKIVKYGAKTAGGLTNSLVATLTTGLGSVGAKATEVSPKVVKVDKNQNGDIIFGGINEEEWDNNKVDANKVFEAVYSQFKTFYIEKIGGALLNKVFTMPKGMKKWFKKKGIEIPKNETWEGVLNRMGYNGVLAEFGEEILDQMAEVPVSELTFDTDEQTGVFSQKNITTTALTTAVLSTLLNIPNAKAYKSKSARLSAEVEGLANSGQKALGKQWNDIQAKIDGAIFGEMPKIMNDISNDKNMSSAQKKLALKYAVAKATEKELVTKYEGEQMARANDNVVMAQKGIEDATVNGINTNDASVSREQQVQEKVAGNSLAKTLGVEGVTEAEQTLFQRYNTTDVSELAISVAQDADLSEEQKGVIQDYLKVKATNLAKQNKVEIDKRNSMAVAKQSIANKTHESGNIYQAELKNGETTYIKVGDISTDQDGNLTTNKDGDNIIVVDEDGNKDMISPKDVVSIAPIDANAEMDNAMQVINAEYAKNLAIANGEYSEGDVVTIRTYNGEEQGYTDTNVTITRESQSTDGTLVIECVAQDGSTLVLNKDDFYKMADDAIADRIASNVKKAETIKPKEQVVKTLTETPQEESTFKGVTPTQEVSVPKDKYKETGIAVIYKDKNGNYRMGTTTSVEDIDHNVIVADDVTGNTDQFTTEQLEQWYAEANAQRAEETESTTEETPSSQEILDNSNVVAEATEEVKQVEQPTETAPQVAELEQVQQPTATTEEQAEVTPQAIETPQVESTATPTQVAIPTDEKGKKVYEQASVEDTINDIYNDPDLEEEEADAFVQAKIDGSTKRIKAIDKKKPKMGEDKDAYVAQRDTWRAERDAEQAKLDYWNNVQSSVPDVRRKERVRIQMDADLKAQEAERNKKMQQAKQAEERGRNRSDYRKAMAQWEDAPSTFHEYVAQALLVGDYKMRWDDNGSSKGLGSHTTGRRTTNKKGQSTTSRGEEYKSMRWLLDKNGESPEALADKLWNEYTDSYGEDMAEGKPLDVLLDVVTSMPTPQSMWEYVKGEHDARMEAEQGVETYTEEEMEYMERDAMFRERFGMSEAEYWDNEAYMDEFIESRQMSAEDWEEFDNFVAEQTIEEYERINEENERNEQRRDSGIGEGGSNVLQGEQLDNNRGNEGIARESQGSNVSGVDSNATPQAEQKQSIKSETAHGVVRNTYSAFVPKEQVEQLNKVAKALGVQIEFVPTMRGANAKIVGNKITVALDAEQIQQYEANGVTMVIGHELTHRIKSLSNETFEDFAKTIEDIFAEQITLKDGTQIPSFKQRMISTRLAYSRQGMKISNEALREEVVADLAGLVMTNGNLMDKFLTALEPKSTKQQILDVIKQMFDAIKGIFQGEFAREIAKAEKVLLESMRKASAVVNEGETTEADKAEEKLSILGVKGAESLDNAEEATIRMDNLAKARKMERFDYPTKSIRMATGWERGADGKWRYEIDDVKLKKTTYENTETTLGELVDNAELFSAYPSLMDLKVVFTDTPNNTLGRTYSQYAEDENGQGAWIPTEISLNNLLVWDDAETESVLAHEIQHAIQSIEGFVNGGDSANKENYHRLAGEVEARNVQSRIGMTPDQRRATLLAETEDVAREDQIFLMENSGVSAMGSTVIKRKKDIAVKLQGKDISPTQLKVVDAFTTDANNIAIDVVDTKGKQRSITLKQGQDNKAGVKHSVLKHYETASNSYTAEEILLIPQIIEQGERKQDGKKVSYKLGINGVTYSVTTEINNRGAEVFTNFYTNRSGNARSSNTQLSAQADSTTTSADKGSDNVGDVQGLEDYSEAEIKDIVRNYIDEVIIDNSLDVEIVDMAIYGSRNRGDAREDSDLDVVVEYRGKEREDDLFNILNDAETQLEIGGVKVDINPIAKGKSGSLSEFMARAREYDEAIKDNTKYSLRGNSQEVADIVAKAKADGTYMKAPNGEATNLTEEQWANVRTKAFKNWFGDWENDPENASKVVDENGEPMVVYHGTESDFNVFDRTKGRASMDIQGMFFSPWELDAQGYGRNVRAFYLNIRKPSSGGESYKALNRYQGQEYAGVKARDYLIGLGYDGVNNYGEEFIAFAPNQIKSATDNIGTYSSESDDIRYSLRGTTDVQSVATDAVIEMLGNSGIEVVKVSDGEAQEMLRLGGMEMSAKKKRALETALLEDKSSFKGTVIPNADVANILNNLDSLAKKYEEKLSNRQKTFIGELSRGLKLRNNGNNSNYATFETRNGRIVTIRVSDHNASSKNMADAGQFNGISIVISRKPNKGITNDGDAHIVEFYYSDKKIAKAEGKPLAEIVRSIKQALYSGEFKDTTGLAERQEVNLNNPEFHIVYHGSGAKFDAFGHSHMGEGEGAQAYGWGAYVTESEGVGREYGKVASYRSGNGRFLYTVEIPDDSNNAYIPFDEVVPNNVINEVKEAIDVLLDTNHFANWYAEDMGMDNTYKVFRPGMTGEMLYKTVSKYLVGDEKASKFLNDMGFVGIKYPTNYMSGGNRKGQNNYVIFNERDAKIIGRVEFLKTPQGEVYGWTDGKKVYLTEKGMNPETPIHEYTHIWARAMKAKNAKGWQSVKDLLRDTPMWNEVMNDANYADIRENEDAVASEVLSRISGKENAERMMQEAQKMIDNAKGVFEKADAVTLVDRMRRALNEFWSWVGKNLFGIEKFNSIEEVTDRVLYDLVEGTELGTMEGAVEMQTTEGESVKYSLRDKKTSQGKRSGAISGTTLSEGLKQERSEHLSQHPLSSNVYDANLVQNTQIAKNRIRKKRNEGGINIEGNTPNDIVRGIGKALGLQKSKSSNSYYQDYYEGDYEIDGKSVRVRLSQHPAKADHIGNSPTDNRISIVVYKDGEHKGEVIAPYSEFIYNPKVLNKKYIADSILDGLESLLNGDGFVVDETQVKRKDYEPKNSLRTKDNEYMDAVNRGDMATAQRLVDEASTNYLNSLLLPNDSDEVGFKFHRGEAPKKTIKRYAVFNVSEDGFRAAYAGNANATPVGVWLDAQNLKSYTSDLVQFDDGTFATYIPGDTGASTASKFSSEKVEELGLKGGQRWLLERGGKHSTDVPNFSQMNLKKNEKGDKVNSTSEGALPHNKLIFEIEYGIAEDGDLTDYVRENGRMVGGRNQGLAKIEPNQYYDFKTNPNAVGNWGIGGTFRIVRLVPHEEVISATNQYKQNEIENAEKLYKEGVITKKDRDARIANANKIKVQKWVGGYQPSDFGLSVESVNEMVKEGKKMKLTDPVTYDDNGNVIPLSERFNPEVEDIRYSLRGVDSDGTIEEYERRVKTTTKNWKKASMTYFNFMEAFVSEMRSLDIVQRIVEKKYGIKLPSFENALDAENRSSSMALKEFEEFMDGPYDNMMRFVDRWIKRGESVESINHYMIAKSGLERNREFTVRDAINERLNNEEISKAQAQRLRDEYADKRNELLEQLKGGAIDYVEFNKQADDLAVAYAYGNAIEDYSGLTGLTSDETNFRDKAEQMVLDFEAKHEGEINDFWGAVKKVTKAPVDKQFASGLMTKEMHTKLTTMFEWYIPMRGFEEVVAEDVYSYIGADTGVFNPTVAMAKGHTDVSDDPLATMGNMMQSAILQGNRNLVKQRLLFMVRNHPIDVLTESRVWLELQADDTWKSSYPELTDDMTADQVADAIKEHEEKMKELAKKGKAKVASSDLDVDFKILNASHQSAHAIDVMLNGIPYVIYVNGNPRVAQAINGQLKDKGTNWLENMWKAYSRYYTAMKTSWDVNFVAPNMVRDIGHSTMITIIDKGLWQGVKYFFNGFRTIVPVVMGVSDAKGMMTPKMRKYWDEFVKYGGETGYAHLNSVEEFKKKNAKRLSRMRTAKKLGAITKGTLKYIGGAFEYMNRIAESSTRFNAYVSSRERGSDIYDSIRMAKDITVNFNQKGAGMTPGVFGALANFYRLWMPFANPIIQGMYQFLKVGKRNKARFAMICSAHIALGYAIPLLNEMLFEALGGDDEDKYINQPDYLRRTNIMIYTGDGYIKIPLAPMFRELYGLGDIGYSASQGLYTPKEATMETIDQIRSLFSLQGQSSMEGKEFSTMRFVLPGQLAWLADIEENTTFTGMPLYKDGEFIDEDTPEYQKVYNGTWRTLVEGSRELNHFLGGTDDKAAEVSSKWMNPAVWQHVATEFGGGPLKFVMDVIDLASPESDNENEPAEFTWSKVPVAKRFYTEVGDRAETRLINKHYYDYLESLDDVGDKLQVSTKKATMGSIEYAEMLNDLILSPDFREYQVAMGYKKAVAELNKYLNSPDIDKTDKEKVKMAIEQFKKEALTEAPKARGISVDEAGDKMVEKLYEIKDATDAVIGEGDDATKDRKKEISDAKKFFMPLNMEYWGKDKDN